MMTSQLPFDGDSPAKRKANILSFKYTPHPHFSQRAHKLFRSIFVDAQLRPNLQDLKWSDFALAYDCPTTTSIDLTK